MSTPLSDPRKTKVTAIQDSHDSHVIHLYGSDNRWLATMDDESFMALFGEWAHASIYHVDAGIRKIEIELFIESKTR